MKRKPIRLGVNDKILIKWFRQASDINTNLPIYLVKQALYRYIKYGTYLDIGHIMYDRSEDDKYIPMRFELRLGELELDIENWIANCPINSSEMIRQVLNRCITVGDNNWIPNIIDIPDYRLDILHQTNNLPLETQEGHLKENVSIQTISNVNAPTVISNINDKKEEDITLVQVTKTADNNISEDDKHTRKKTRAKNHKGIMKIQQT